MDSGAVLDLPTSIGCNHVMQEPKTLEGFGSNTFDNLTTLHPLGVLVLALGIIGTLIVQRRYAWLPLLLIACFVSTSQRVVIATLDFNFVRLMIAAATLRIIQRREFSGLRITTLDKLITAWVIVNALAYVLRVGTFSSLVFKLGMSYDSLGLYLLGRTWLRSGEDLRRFARAAGILACISGVAFAIEWSTGRNIFSIFGGVSEFTQIRQERLRCQGPFSHPILAGAFWLSPLALILALVWSPRGKPIAIAGALSISAITFFCSSSTPLLGWIATAGFASLWFLRKRTAILRIGTVCTLVALHLIMEAPVWHLIARASVVGGSTGYHRYKLIDAFINNWSEWFLVGVSSTAHWGWFLFDVANQFVMEGTDGGILTLVLFLLILHRAFANIGRRIRRARTKQHAIEAWAIGTAIAAQCVMFIGVTISQTNTNMVMFVWLLAASEAKWGYARSSGSGGPNDLHAPTIANS